MGGRPVGADGVELYAFFAACILAANCVLQVTWISTWRCTCTSLLQQRYQVRGNNSTMLQLCRLLYCQGYKTCCRCLVGLATKLSYASHGTPHGLMAVILAHSCATCHLVHAEKSIICNTVTSWSSLACL